MNTCKLMLLLLGLCGYCCAGPVGTKRNMPITQRDDQPMISQPTGSEEDQPEDQRIPPELMSTLTLPSNATSIRADITDNFSCENKMYGYYADVENECQIFHVCLPVTYADGKENTFRWSFICPEETIFSQESFTCMRPDDMNFDCKESLKYYELNSNFGAVEEDTNTNSNNNNVMTAPNEEEQEAAIIMQPEVQQPDIEEPMEIVAAPPKPTLTQPMKEIKKPVKVQVPNRRKPSQTQMGIMKKPASTVPLRKLPQVVPNIEPAAAVALETKPAEEEEKPIYQKYHKRPTTVQATSFKDKVQTQKPVKNTPIRAELYNQVRKRPTYSNKKDTPMKEKEAQEETVEMSQPELSEPEPTLKLETIFMPAQKTDFAAVTQNHAAETSADITAQASIADEVYVKPEENVGLAANQADISSKPVAIANAYEEKEALTPEAPKTSVENLATVEGVLKTEEPDSVEENITSVESLKTSVLTAEASNVAETAVVSENFVEPDMKFSETEPVVEFLTANEPDKLEVQVPEVQEAEEEKLVLTNAVEKEGVGENAKATDEEETPAVTFTVPKAGELEEAEKPVVKVYVPNQPETSVPEEVENVSPNQAEQTEVDAEQEEKDDDKPVVQFTLANQAEETNVAPEIAAPEEVENVAVKFVASNQVEKTKTEPETAETEVVPNSAVKFVPSNPTKTETEPETFALEDEETPAVKLVSSNPAEKTETQPETSASEEQETSAVKLMSSNPAEKTEETVATQNTQETEPVVPELSDVYAVKTAKPEFKPDAPTDSGDNSQQIIEAIEEIPAVIVELEEHKPVMAEEQNTVDDFNQDNAEAFAQPNETLPVDVSASLEEMEEAKPNNAVERMEATAAMQEHDPIVQTMFANTLKQSSGGFKPVDPAMAAEAEALITDFLSTLMKSESSNNKPIYPGVAQVDSDIVENQAEENKLESEATVEEEKKTENIAKVETAPEVDKAVSPMLKNDAPISNILMFNQLPESMYQIPVQVVTLPDEAEKPTPEIVEKHDETHTHNKDALHVKNANEEASQNEVEQAQSEHLAALDEEKELASNATPDMQQLKTHVDSTDSYTPLSIDDIVELVKERLEQKPAETQVNWAESSEPQVAAESSESEQIVEKLENLDEIKPNEQQFNEEIIMPIYQRVIDVDPNMLKSHHHLLVNEPMAIMTESKPITTEVKPEESIGEVEVVDIKKALETPAESVEVALDPTTVITQQATAPEVPVPTLEFVVDPKTGRFYRSRSLKNTKMDPRKRRFLFRSDAS